MHSLLHYYASQKLLAQPDLHSRTSDRHSEYYCTLLAEFEITLKGSGEQEVMNEISAALPNLKAAFEWAYTHRLAARQAKALEGLALFYSHQDRTGEG